MADINKERYPFSYSFPWYSNTTVNVDWYSNIWSAYKVKNKVTYTVSARSSANDKDDHWDKFSVKVNGNNIITNIKVNDKNSYSKSFDIAAGTSISSFTVSNSNSRGLVVSISFPASVWSGKSFTITFDKQSGTGGSNSVTAYYGSNMPAITLPTRSQYTFNGYYDTVGSSGNKYYNSNGSSAKTWNKTSNTTLYAGWTRYQYNVTLNKNEGSGGSSSIVATKNENLPNINIPTRSGYKFTGYFTSTSGGTKYIDDNGVGVKSWDRTQDTTLYAQWIREYIVTFHMEGGSTDSTTTSGTLLNSQLPIGHQNFDEWCTEFGSSIPYTESSGIQQATIQDNIDLYLRSIYIDKLYTYNKGLANYSIINSKPDTNINSYDMHCGLRVWSLLDSNHYSDNPNDNFVNGNFIVTYDPEYSSGKATSSNPKLGKIKFISDIYINWVKIANKVIELSLGYYEYIFYDKVGNKYKLILGSDCSGGNYNGFIPYDFYLNDKNNSYCNIQIYKNDSDTPIFIGRGFDCNIDYFIGVQLDRGSSASLSSIRTKLSHAREFGTYIFQKTTNDIWYGFPVAVIQGYDKILSWTGRDGDLVISMDNYYSTNISGITDNITIDLNTQYYNLSTSENGSYTFNPTIPRNSSLISSFTWSFLNLLINTQLELFSIHRPSAEINLRDFDESSTENDVYIIDILSDYVLFSKENISYRGSHNVTTKIGTIKLDNVNYSYSISNNILTLTNSDSKSINSYESKRLYAHYGLDSIDIFPDLIVEILNGLLSTSGISGLSVTHEDPNKYILDSIPMINYSTLVTQEFKNLGVQTPYDLIGSGADWSESVNLPTPIQSQDYIYLSYIDEDQTLINYPIFNLNLMYISPKYYKVICGYVFDPSKDVVDEEIVRSWTDSQGDEIYFPISIYKNMTLIPIGMVVEIPSEITIGYHEFTLTSEYLSKKSNRLPNEFIVTSENNFVSRYFGQDDENYEKNPDGSRSITLSYLDNNEPKTLTINQQFPKFSRFETFDETKYIAVAEGWGNDINDGSSWDHPKYSIPEEPIEGIKLLVFDGTYGGELGEDYSNRSDIILVNGLDSVDNKKFYDKFTGNYSIDNEYHGYEDETNKIIYDTKDPDIKPNYTYIRCTFTEYLNYTVFDNNIFNSCVFSYLTDIPVDGCDNYCFDGINEDLGLDSNGKPIYGSIIIDNAEYADLRLLDADGQPRIRSGIDCGCYEYQNNFKPHSVGIIITKPNEVTTITSNPNNTFNWFDNSISGYPYSLSWSPRGTYIGDFYYQMYGGEVNEFHLYENNSPISLYITIYKEIDDSHIFIDNFNYTSDSLDSRELYLKDPTKYGLTPNNPKGVVVTTLRSAVNLANNGKTIVFCRGIYPQNSNSVIINKNITIESDYGADETILVGDSSENTSRFITVNSGNFSITGVTIINSRSKKPLDEGSSDRYGGAIYKTGSGSVKVEACRFRKCSANVGGAVYGSNLYSCIVDTVNLIDASTSYSYSGKDVKLTSHNGTLVLTDQDVSKLSMSPSPITLTFNIRSGAHRTTDDGNNPGEWTAHYCLFTVTINGNSKSLYSGDNKRGDHDWHSGDDYDNDGEGKIIFSGITNLSKIDYAINYKGHHVSASNTYMRITIPGLTWTRNLSPSFAATSGNLINCTMFGSINNSSICNSALNCINLSNQTLTGSTNVNGNYNTYIGKFYRIPYNIINISAKISNINLVNEGGTDINSYLDFNLKPRGYQK